MHKKDALSRKWVGVLVALLCVTTVLPASPVRAGEPLEVIIADPFIDVRTGPGRGYPIFHVVEEGGRVELLRRHTQWIKVRTPRGREGWVSRSQLSRTLDDTGSYVAMADVSQDDFFRAHAEAGVMLGEFDGITSFAVRAGYAFTENLQVDLEWTEVASNVANTQLLSAMIQHHMYPRWRLSPYVLVGGGDIDIEPATVLVAPKTTSNRTVFAGLGLRAYLTRGFVIRSEYRNLVVLTDDNENDELDEWRVGFSVLF